MNQSLSLAEEMSIHLNAVDEFRQLLMHVELIYLRSSSLELLKMLTTTADLLLPKLKQSVQQETV